MTDHYVTEMEREIAGVLNKYSEEQESGTPDYILARYLIGCLNVFNETMLERSGWLGKDVESKDPYLTVMESMDGKTELFVEKEPEVRIPVTIDGNVVGMATVNPETGIGEATMFSDVLSSKLVGGFSIRGEDAEPLPDHEHKPVQHRDGKVPWCNECELDSEYKKPVSKLGSTRNGGEITIHNQNFPVNPMVILRRQESLRIPNA